MLPRAIRPALGPLLDRWLRRNLPLWQGQLIALGCVAAAAFLRMAIAPLVDGGLPLVTFFPAILVASLLGGPLSGLTTLAASSIIASYVWLDQRMSFNLTPESGLRLLVLWLLGGSLIIIATLLRALLRALVDSEERAMLLAYEMTHRARNVLGLAQAISRQTCQSAANFSEFQTMFETRLAALGRAQELVVANPDFPADLRTLVERVLEPFGTENFSLVGAPTGVPHEIGSTLALLLHELGTNSLKYGALSVPEGRIAIAWILEKNRTWLDWREKNGPKVLPPSRSGFGSRLIRTAFPPGRGEASIDFAPNGVECHIVFPRLSKRLEKDA